MKIIPIELAWAAGLFEGEGCFTTAISFGRSNRYRTRSFSARLGMIDEDVVRRFAALFPYGQVRYKEPKQPHHLPQWEWYTASFEGFQATVALLWPWLGARRRARAKEILLLAREYFASTPLRGRPRRKARR